MSPAAGTIFDRLRGHINDRLPQGSLRARFAAGAFWLLVGAGLAQILTMLAGVIVARVLGKEGFGQYSMLQSTVGTLGILGGMGLGMTSMKHIAQFRNTDPAKAGRMIALASVVSWVSGFVISGAVMAAANFLARTMLNASHLSEELQIASPILLFSAVNGAQLGTLMGLESFRAVAKANILRGLVTFPLVLVGLYLTGLAGSIAGLSAATALTCIGTYFLLRREIQKAGIPIHYSHISQETGTLWRFSLPALVSTLLFSPVELMIFAVIVNWHPHAGHWVEIPWLSQFSLLGKWDANTGYAELGLFNGAKLWHVVMLYLPSLLSQISLPVLSNLWGENQFSRYRRVLVMNTLLLALCAAVIAIPVALASPWIMSLFGPGFQRGWLVLVLTCGYSVLWAGNMVVGQAIWAAGRAGAGMAFAAIRAVIMIGLALLLLPYGAFGLALAYLVTGFLQTLYQFPYALSILRKQEKQVPAVAPVIVAAIVDPPKASAQAPAASNSGRPE